LGKPILLRYKIGLGFLSLLILAYFTTPYAIQSLVKYTLKESGYDNVGVQSTQWSKQGFGFTLDKLHAQGGGLPTLNFKVFDVWLVFSKLFEGNIDLQGTADTLQGKVALKFISQIGHASSAFQTKIEHISMAEVLKLIPQNQMPSALAHLKLTANVSLQVSSQWNEQGPSKAKYNTTLHMKEVSLKSSDDTTLLAMDNLNITGLLFDAYTSSLSVQSIALENTNLSPNTKTSKSLASVNGLKITNLRLSDFQDLTIDEININGADVQLFKNKQGKFEAWNQLISAIESKSAAKKKGKTSPPFHFTLHQTHSENLKINFQDLSKTPEIQIPILVKKLAVTGVSNAPKSDLAKWNADGDLFQLGTWQANGAMNTVNIDAYSNTHLLAQNINLPPFSGYTAESFGQGLKAGNINLDLSVLIENNKLKAKGEIFARKLAFTTIDNVSNIKDTLVPIDSALDVLRDGDGNIKLSLASEGSLDDPTFDVGGIWNKVLLEATQRSAIYVLGQALQPYALVFTAGKFLYDQSKKIHLNPITFKVASASLTTAKPNVDDYANKIIALIQKKPQLVLEICPKYTNEEQASGVQLSAARSDAFVNHLTQHGLKASHITKCLPTLDTDKKAKPTLDLRLI